MICTNYMNVPYNIELEQSLLASLLHNNKCLNDIEFLQDKHFYNPLNGKIYRTIKNFYYREMLATPVTIAHFFLSQGEDHKNYIIELVKCFLSLSSVQKWAEQIYDLYLRRELLMMLDSALHGISDYEKYETARACIESIDNHLYALICDQEVFKEFELFSDAANKTIHALQNNARRSGLSSGFIELDKLLGGLHKSDLIILAGRPSMGKTALGANIAYNVSKLGKTTLFFSLEMSTDQLITRTLAQEAQIPSHLIRQGNISNADISKFIEVARTLEGLPLLIDDNCNIDVVSLCNKAKRLRKKQEIDLIVIDYLQLLRSKQQSENRIQELSDITRQLKALAKSIDVPILALSQLSRAVESRDDKKPQLSDLRESGSIEQDADIVIFIYREEYYLSRKGIHNPSVANKAELIIAKQRHGPIGNIILHYDSKYTKFSNLTSMEECLHF